MAISVALVQPALSLVFTQTKAEAGSRGSLVKSDACMQSRCQNQDVVSVQHNSGLRHHCGLMTAAYMARVNDLSVPAELFVTSHQYTEGWHQRLSQMGGSNLPRPHLVIFYFFPSA